MIMEIHEKSKILKGYRNSTYYLSKWQKGQLDKKFVKFIAHSNIVS